MLKIERSEEWFDERVEAFVDGILPKREANEFSHRLTVDPSLRASVEKAQLVASILRSEKLPACPPSLTDKILQRAAEHDDRQGMSRLVNRPPLRRVPIFRGRRVQVAAVLAAACLAFFVLLKDGGTAESQAYSQQDIEQALREAKFALAVVSDASRDASRTIRVDAVPRLTEAIGLVLADPQGRQSDITAPGGAQENEQ